LALFDLKRVDTYLAAQNWIRTVSQTGQVALGGYRYGLGSAWAEQTVSVSFDTEQRQFVFTQVRPDTQQGRRLPELASRPSGCSRDRVEDLTGLLIALETLPAPTYVAFVNVLSRTCPGGGMRLSKTTGDHLASVGPADHDQMLTRRIIKAAQQLEIVRAAECHTVTQVAQFGRDANRRSQIGLGSSFGQHESNLIWLKHLLIEWPRIEPNQP
jgi:hypothetical protein